MNHFTNKRGYNAIRAASPWHFRAAKPPGDHEFGAYFTTLAPETPYLALRLGIPKTKTEFLFSFIDRGDLRPMDNDRGDFIFYSSHDYDVEENRQRYNGRSDES